MSIQKMLKDVLKIHEMDNQLRHVYCADENKELEELTSEEIIKECEWIYEKLGWDIDEACPIDEKEEIKDYKKDRRQIKNFLKKYKK